ncbi:outer membrane protein [Bradyrhizobium guangdongense]
MKRRALYATVSLVALASGISAARAADLSVNPPSPPIASWTGWYVGTHLGSGWGYDGWRSGSGVLAPLTPFFGEASSGGAIAGAQIGYNKQFGRWVLGAEADASFADLQGIAECANGLWLCRTRTNALGTATARLGLTVDQFLLYGKGGLGWAHEQFAMLPYPSFGIPNQFSGDAMRLGWTAGLGLEYAFSPALSAKVEYDWLDFGNKTTRMTDQFGNQSDVVVGSHAQLVKLGLNYHLGNGLPAFATGAGPAFMSAAAPSANRNWTGFYVGVHGGGGWGRTDWKQADGVFNTFADSIFAGSGEAGGMMVGGQAGYAWQFGRWVTGIEGEASWADVDSNAKCAVSEVGPTSFNCHSRIDALGALTGRLGTTYGNLLIYGKAGAAWAHETHDAVNPQTAFGALPTNRFTADDTRWGYTIGTGLEYAFSPAWSAKVEYDYANFGSKTVAFTDQFGNVSNVGLWQDLHSVKMGVNYKLGADPAAAAYASAVPSKAYVKAPEPFADWSIEAGARAFVSSGRKAQDLGAIPGQDNIVSRLSYRGMTGYAAELFARLDHRDGIFVKGNLGLGDFAGGTMNDEDFVPGVTPYSNTRHQQRDGRLRYGALDVGYDVIKGPAGELGPYVGYRSFYESGPTFGCVQVANGGICAPPTTQDTSLLALSETETWRGVAVGLNTRVPLSDRWKLEIDAAYLPYVNFQGHDQHWNRPDINPGPEHGDGWGTQIEAIVSYAMTDRWNVGVGGRYVYLATNNAYTQFPAVSPNQLEKFYTERWGGFVQTSYRFGGDMRAQASAASAASSPAAPRDWTGVYIGGHLGAGAGTSDFADPYPSFGFGDRVRTAGAVAGAQIGVNYQRGHAVVGLEAAGSWSRVEGTFTCFTGFPDPFAAGMNCGSTLDRLATFTGRLGYAADSTLYYVKAGAAVGHTNFMLNADPVLNAMGLGNTGGVLNSSTTAWGWTAGAGIEHALDAHWSVVGDYKYVDLGSTPASFANAPDPLAAVQSETIKQRYHVMTLGVNYKLDWTQFAGRGARAD